MSDLCLRELHSEFLYFLPQLPDDTSVGVFVNDGVVDNVLGSVGVAERRQGFLVVVCCWAHCCNHGCATVSTQAVLENEENKEMKRSDVAKCAVQPVVVVYLKQPSQNRVSVGNKLGLVLGCSLFS